ncbi:HNH endonuclease domain-containing protein [Leeuwenhoekiella aequorea]|uniref:HNH endonuclease domain-containing protein n=1 Tax=Leeuwenhoekiella aequorea TaxID=283736 RepID=UPI00352FE037
MIDLIQENSPYLLVSSDRVQIPTGLLIEKWLLYYYPILESHTPIPQINGSANLAFREPFIQLIDWYRPRGCFSAFYNDLKNKEIPATIQDPFFNLLKKIRDTITKIPMKYIGRSISDAYYSIFEYQNKRLRRPEHLDLEYLILEFGSFSIPRDYYETFKILGSFIGGQDAILFKWAEFSLNASGQELSVKRVLNEVLKSPITARHIAESKKLYQDILNTQGQVHCVWTGKRIGRYALDHVIPFSIWKNNDLWNLLPSAINVNAAKSDKIPAPELIERQRDRILEYWKLLHENQQRRFKKEIQVALLGNHAFDTWKQEGITQLQNSCNYLIETRGFEALEVRLI